HSDVARVTQPVRGALLVLSTEKSPDGYRRLADVTDGDAYYWSSVNPATNHDHARKLSEMSRTVHKDGKFWMAPFAPGFDARQVARRLVERPARRGLSAAAGRRGRYRGRGAPAPGVRRTGCPLAVEPRLWPRRSGLDDVDSVERGRYCEEVGGGRGQLLPWAL